MYKLIAPGSRRRDPARRIRAGLPAGRRRGLAQARLPGRPHPRGGRGRDGAGGGQHPRVRTCAPDAPPAAGDRARRVPGAVGACSWCSPAWSRGEHLRTHTKAPYTRGAIRARDGEILASGPASNRVYPQGSAFSDVTGYVKTPAADRVAARVAKGWPAQPAVRPGGARAVARRRARRPPRRSICRPSPRPARHARWASAPAPSPRTWSPRFASTSSTTRPTRWVGATAAAVVLDPKSGAVEASVGLGMEVLQPPGSSFKTVTAAAALSSQGGDPLHHLSVRPLRRAERLAAPQLPQGVVRRIVPAGLRGQLQLGVRAGGRPGRRPPAGGDGESVRLQPARARSATRCRRASLPEPVR